jgi:hypothetical protein
MSNFNESELHEYDALMSRGRDAERTATLGWTASGLVAAALLTWAIAGKHPIQMLPVVLAVAYGFQGMMRARQQVRLIAGYVAQFHEERGQCMWFTRLSRLSDMPGFNVAGDWMTVGLANAVTLIAGVLAWTFAQGRTDGNVWATVATGCAVAFAYFSVTSTYRLHQTDYARFWQQSDANMAEVRPASRSAPR